MLEKVVWVRWDGELYSSYISETDDASVLEAARSLYREGLGVPCAVRGKHVVDITDGEILPYSVSTPCRDYFSWEE